MARGWGSFVILAKRTPFEAEDRRTAEEFCAERGFSIVWPRTPGPADAEEGAEERSLREALEDVLAGPSGPGGGEPGLFDLSPATDDSPYFHRFARLRSLPDYRRLLGSQWIPFVEWGVVFLVVSLAVSLALSAACLLLPLAFARLPRAAGGASFVAYFSALGLAYMLIELTFLKAGILLLGDAIRAATASIGGFAFFSGFGSALSGKLGKERTMRLGIFPGIAFLALAGFLSLSLSKEVLLPMAEWQRTAAFLLSLAPAAFFMGIPFPAGLSRLAGEASASIPFAWGVNGFFSVAGASLASVGALWIGLRGTVFLGALLYAAAAGLFARIGGSFSEEA
jgi:hypothetical protein